jgi:nucleotide-binding universal stress UspA family protein
MKLSTILVPLDGSDVAEAALTPAVELARTSGAKMVLLRAAEAHSGPLTDPVEAQVQVMREAEQYLTAAQSRVKGAGVSQVEVSAWYGPPAEAIVEAARHRKVDLIVMSSHGRTGVARLVMGSVAESVLRTTAVPILLIRAAGAPLDTPVTGAPRAKEVSRV